MRHRFISSHRSLLVVLAAFLLALPAEAQISTATVSGIVADATGPVPGARVVATNTQTGFTREAVAAVDGGYRLAGLQPGTYRITVTAEAYREQSRTVQLLVGQESTADFRLAVDAVYAETVTVVGEGTPVLMDTRSPEISTNITQQQIESLPLNNRNFLAFAGLAPGVSFTRDSDGAGQTFTSGAQDSKQVNVFIDGVSFKNDIIKGGAFMQDNSRGNPFPQSAVQEYQVLTQNYKAEYEKATAAVITAVTKSGGNDFNGDVFWFFQDEGLVEQDDFARERGDEKIPFERNQYGLSLGGPIMRDRLHFFVTGERNERDRVASVFVGPEWDNAPASVRDFLDDFPTGSVAAPFESTLFFGKLSFQPTMSQSAEFSYHMRDEDELRGFGGQRVAQGGENILIGTDAATLRHQLVFGANAINELTLSYQDMSWAQTATDVNSPNLNFINLLNVGGISYIQDLAQQRLGLRDDFSFYFSGAGSHTLKAGLVASTASYDFTKSAFLNPVFEFRQDENWQFPFLARVGAGDPSLDFGNNQYGLYIQDDWRMGNLTISGGVRWDYETNMLNNNWVTPPAVAQGLRTACREYPDGRGGRTEWCIRDLFDVEEYISDGSNRESPSDLLQPRIGASYDIGGGGRTVVFGGWGLYYDRVTLNDIYDEAYRHQWGQYTLCFKQGDVVPANCPATAIEWDPAYLQPGRLAQLVQSGAAGAPEVFLLSNDTGVPQSTQWTVGVRQQIGRNWLGALTYANSRSENGLVWSFASVPPGTNFDDRWGSWISIPGYGFMMRSFDDREREYDGIYLTLDRPRTAGSPWGMNFAYTYSEGFQNASLDDGTAFAFDFLPPNFPMFPANGDERHRVMLSGNVALPLNFEASSIIQLGSGTPISYAEALTGPFHFYPNGARPPQQSFLGIDEFAYRSVDVRLQWNAPAISGARISIIGEAFNLFDYDNYSGFDTWGGGLNSPNPNFLTPNAEFNTRRYQIGARVEF